MTVVMAPDSFKGTATAADAAAALRRGWRKIRPDDDVVLLPMADGGEGTLEVLAAAHPRAHRRRATVTGPDGRAVAATWLLLPDGTGAVELAETSGLPLMATLDALNAHTLGLGEMIARALDAGVEELVVALGGSASTDGGTGALTALGARFTDASGRALSPGGDALRGLAAIDPSGLRPPPRRGITLLVDVGAPLLGPRGAAAVFGPQKGATPADVERLDAGLARLAELCGEDPDAPGAGAAGGAAYGLAALWGARVTPGASAMAALAGLPDAVAACDLVVTGEGRVDATSFGGKVVGAIRDLLAGVAGADKPALAVVGGEVDAIELPGIEHLVSLADLAGDPARARSEAVTWLARAGGELARRVSRTEQPRR
jgi:glycerate kinase